MMLRKLRPTNTVGFCVNSFIKNLLMIKSFICFHQKQESNKMQIQAHTHPQLSPKTGQVALSPNIASILIPCFEKFFCTQNQFNDLLDLIREAENGLNPENLQQKSQVSQITAVVQQLVRYKTLEKKIEKLSTYITHLRNQMKTKKSSHLISVAEKLAQNVNISKTTTTVIHQQKSLIKAIIERQMGLTGPSWLSFVCKQLKQSQSIVLKEFFCLLILKETDPTDEICCVSHFNNYQQYLQEMRDISLLSQTFVDDELRSKFEEFDCLQQIYQCKRFTAKAQEFEDQINVCGNQNRVIKWYLSKAKVLEKSECNAEAQESFNRVLSLLEGMNKKIPLKVQLQKASLLLKKRPSKHLKQLLLYLKQVSYQNQDYKSAATSHILLSQYLLKKKELEESLQHQQEAENLSRLHQFSLEGKIVGDSYYRAGEYLWKQTNWDKKGKEKSTGSLVERIRKQKRTVLDHYLRKAFEAIGGSDEPEILLFKMKHYGEFFREFDLIEPALKRNDRIKNLKIGMQQKLKTESLEMIFKGHWTVLQSLNLESNMIGPQGCNHLRRARLPVLQLLNLEDNQIGDEGCKFLRKAKWPTLILLNLQKNNISGQGCFQLSKAQWPDLESLNLSSNSIGLQGCNKLREAQWPVLQSLSLSSTQIDRQACESLNRSQWLTLQYLTLSYNQIISISFLMLPSLFHSYSSQTIFCNIKYLDFQGCFIVSIQPLCQLNAPLLQFMHLEENSIVTINPLLKIKSRIMKVLQLKSNPIMEIHGLEWFQLRYLEYLSLNQTFVRSKRSLCLKPVVKCQFNKSQFALKSENGSGFRRVKVMQKPKANFQIQTMKSLERKYQRHIFKCSI